ncbi:hypothetical protein [Listeria goaensis]|uniref:hypothetical protein n=1 Tax=Listeria goaensis TaxID=1649188 RepID=UPI000B590897|nr:hypothetical protein [Listeria goaensis]
MWLYEKSVAERIVSAPIDRVWELLANRSNVSWRTDIIRVETEPSSKKITEFYPNGQKLEFHIIDEQPTKYRVYKIKHRFFSGYIWEEYKTAKDNQTRVIITEKIRMNNDLLGVISRLALNLEQGQVKYLHDIEMVLTR